MKIVLFICLIYLTLPCSLSALPSNYALQMRKAQAYLENQQFSKARDIYQDLLQDSTESWQRAILMYDLGTLFLEEGEWDKASETFKAISYDYDLAPLLRYRVLYNLIIAHAKQGLSLKQKDPELALKRTALAENELPLLKPFFCELEKTLGETDCKEPEELISLKSILPLQIASIRQEIDRQRIDNAKIPDALRYLSESTKQAIEYVEFLDKIPQDNLDLMKRYQTLFFTRLNKIKLLWENTKIKIIGNTKDPKQKERLDLFEEAYTEFKHGLEALTTSGILSSKASFAKALEILNKLIAMPPPPTAETKNEPLQEEFKEPVEEKRNAAANNIEKLLLQIYQEDQLPSPKPQTTEKKELQPW